MINQIFPQQVVEDYLSIYIYPDMVHDYYWSQTWDAKFYVDLCCAGFISVTTIQDRETYLLPQIQRSYAVLDWNNVHLSKNVLKIMARGGLLAMDCELKITKNIEAVMAAISDSHGDANWMVEPYRDLLRRVVDLGADKTFAKSFELVAVELRCKAGSDLIAGELGYSIGSVYTSLSGFLDKRHLLSKHMGTVQLLALAGLLHQHGFQFWNLGHPHMQYKRDLGAKPLPRTDFLARWEQACKHSPASGLLYSFDQSVSAHRLVEHWMT